MLKYSPGFVGVSYGFLLSTVCSTTAEAMKLSIRFSSLWMRLLLVKEFSKYFCHLTKWWPSCCIGRSITINVTFQFLLPFFDAVWYCLASGGYAPPLAKVFSSVFVSSLVSEFAPVFLCPHHGDLSSLMSDEGTSLTLHYISELNQTSNFKIIIVPFFLSESLFGIYPRLLECRFAMGKIITFVKMTKHNVNNVY